MEQCLQILFQSIFKNEVTSQSEFISLTKGIILKMTIANNEVYNHDFNIK